MPTPTEQLLSRTVYATDGSTVNWDFSFASGYLDPSHVKAYTTDSLGARTDIVVTLPMLIGEFQLQITPALAAGLELTIYRDTPKNAPLVDFTDESGFSEISLDTNAKQAVMVAAEAIDTVNATDVQAAIDAAETAATAAANAAADAGTAAADAAAAALSASAADASEAAAAGYAASINPVNFATAAQGAKADTALQPATIGVTVASQANGALAATALQPGSTSPRAARIDVASVAGTVDLTANAPNTDDIRITGALTITGFTVAVGRVLRVTAGGAFTLTNGASIITQTGANIVAAAGDTLMLRATAANTVEVLGYKSVVLPLAQGGTGAAVTRQLAQVQTFVTGALATGTTILPLDDTIPQNTEGDQYMSLAITPTNASSTLEIDVEWFGANDTLNTYMMMALFQDTTANALASGFIGNIQIANGIVNGKLQHSMTAGTTSATTFKVRAGGNGGTTTFNGRNAGRIFGGNMASRITIREYLP